VYLGDLREEFVLIVEYALHNDDGQNEATRNSCEAIIKCKCLLHSVLQMKNRNDEVRDYAQHENDLSDCKQNKQAAILVVEERKELNSCAD